MAHPLRSITFLQKLLFHDTDAASRTNHAEIRRFFSFSNHPQAVRIMAVSARNDTDIVALLNLEFFDRMPKVITDHLLCHRETSRIREGKAVVHHSYQESDARAKFCHRKSHMAASENNQALFREKWFRHIPTASGAPTDRLPLCQGFFSNLRRLCTFFQFTAHIC